MPGLAPRQKVRTGRVLEGYPNTPPVVNITYVETSNPIAGEGFQFRATAVDNEQGDLSSGIVWSTVADGVLGVGGDVSLTFTTTGAGQVLTATATDAFGTAGTDTTTLNVGP